MARQIPLGHDDEVNTGEGGRLQEVAADISYVRTAIVNVVFFGIPEAGEREWTLIDAGVRGSAGAILKAAEARFGADSRPSAIVMTHGHFDHVGALPELAQHWQVPIFAHEHEHPFLNGSDSYPPPDPSVGGGMMARLSRFYPRSPVDVSEWLRPLPESGAVPSMPDWRWIHTPGHTRGHVSLWRQRDQLLISGDAVVSTDQESAYAVAVQKPELHGPPQYFTPDWTAARESVARLAKLSPQTLVTGHGPALEGDHMTRALEDLALRFEEVAIP